MLYNISSPYLFILIDIMLKVKCKKILAASMLLASVVGCTTEKPTNQLIEVKRGNVVYSSFSINEQIVKQAVKDSKFQVTQRSDAIIVTMPVKESFNSKRPDVLLPVTLGPLTNIAKLVKQDSSSVIIIVGHTDSTGSPLVNNDISKKRAKSVSSVFSVAGLNANHLFATGVGDNQPLDSNKTAKGRENNKRVEIFIVQKQDRDLSTLPNLYAVTNFPKNN